MGIEEQEVTYVKEQEQASRMENKWKCVKLEASMVDNSMCNNLSGEQMGGDIMFDGKLT